MCHALMEDLLFALSGSEVLEGGSMLRCSLFRIPVSIANTRKVYERFFLVGSWC